MDTKHFSKKNNAPKDLSTEAINKFKLELSYISKEMTKGSISTFNDETTIKKQITVADEEMLHNFLKEHKENKDFKTVIQKVRLVDYLYSTNLRMSGSRIYADISNIILETPDFDERVEKGCLDLIDELANSIKDITGKNHFSFVTKYCCNHNFHIYNNDNYSIYDTALNNAIPHYLKVTHTYIYDDCRGKIDYKQYHSIISDLIKEYEINTENSRRDIDLYLWSIYRYLDTNIE